MVGYDNPLYAPRTLTRAIAATVHPRIDTEYEAEALDLLDALPAGIRGRVTSVTVDAADHVSFRAGGTTVVWGDDSEPRLKVQVVELLLAKKPKLLDVSAPSTPVTR